MRAKFIYEKFTEDSDPIRDMRIGAAYKARNFKSMDEYFEWLYQIIPTIVKVDSIMDIFNEEFNGQNGIIYPAMYNQIVHYCDEYLTIHNEKLDNLISGDFKKYVKKRQKINEKFTDESDPIRDMRIGVYHKIEEWLYQKDPEYHVIRNPIIRTDCKIDADSVDISREKYRILPTYIKFGKITGRFACHFSNKNEIQQLPEYVGEHLRIFTFDIPDFTKKDILDVCNVKLENIDVHMCARGSSNYETIEIK